VVFGCAVALDGAPRPALVRRLKHALAEARRHPSALVVVSGGSVRGRPPEAYAMRDWLLGEGLDRARVVVEAASRSTPDNASFCAEILAGAEVSRVTLVTERYHMRRSRRLLAAALGRRCPEVRLESSAAPDRLRGLGRALRAVSEIVKLSRDLLWPPRASPA
jgi:uncharacterized SAM-binding protein YcdF (DUF218 family)